MNITNGTSGGFVAPWFDLAQPWLPWVGTGGVSMAATPGTIRTSHATAVTFTGVGTTWTSSAPSLSASGVAGVSIGPVTVLSDTACGGQVTTGAATGTVTWTDATSGATAPQVVGQGPYADPLTATARVVGADPLGATARIAST